MRGGGGGGARAAAAAFGSRDRENRMGPRSAWSQFTQQRQRCGAAAARRGRQWQRAVARVIQVDGHPPEGRETEVPRFSAGGKGFSLLMMALMSP